MYLSIIEWPIIHTDLVYLSYWETLVKCLMTKQVLYLDKLTGNEGHLYLDNVMANKNSFILIKIFINYYLLLCILETG
jgi:hypothetical protein